ncbi:Uncharacterised protein [Vibrio cholerae]|nr:Uncharacterised protein [Vibrio cholerae]CSB11156.1 Uncharacterised protein [Vibrio cholerae]CSB16087.1 Uncharacterised protein [Vibrio cholerae]CSB24336.1 Uncharacterised protein [Vibrio cholerae]CSB29212.1 Uncharacterised protein [Vibrio cholerae]
MTFDLQAMRLRSMKHAFSLRHAKANRLTKHIYAGGQLLFGNPRNDLLANMRDIVITTALKFRR